MLFHSKWVSSSWIRKDQSTIASSIPVGSICEIKAINLHTLLRDRQVVTPLDISPMKFWIEWSFVGLHSFGRFGCSYGAYGIWSWFGSSFVTLLSFSSWFGSWYISRFVFSKILAINNLYFYSFGVRFIKGYMNLFFRCSSSFVIDSKIFARHGIS